MPNEERLEFIAEIGLAHNGEIDKARIMIELAANAGADYVKTQYYVTENVVSQYTDREWYDRLRRKEVGIGFIERMQSIASDYGVKFLCSAHSLNDFRYLIKNLDPLPAFKMGSGEVGNVPYYQYVANTSVYKNIPILWSTGCMNMKDILQVKSIFNQAGCIHIPLECNTSYPTPYEDVYLTTCQFGYGFSDHCEGNAASICAVYEGARIIEKHFILSEDWCDPCGQDWKGALNESTIGPFIRELNNAAEIGKSDYEPNKRQAKWATKSITAAVDIPMGTYVTEEMLTLLRPGIGLSWDKKDQVIGKYYPKDLKAGELILVRGRD